MVIGVDARALAFPGTGNARYLHQVLRYLIPMRKKDTFVFFSHRDIHSEYQDLLDNANTTLDPHRSRLPGMLWMQKDVPGLLEAHQVDVFWGTITLLPLKKTTAQIVNFHDLNSFVARDTMEGWTAWQHRLLNPRMIRQADQVLCLSRTTREHIRRHIKGVNAGSLTVVYPGFEMPETKPSRPAGFKSSWKDFLLMVGTIEPRKNQKVVVDGYRHARAKQQASMKSRSGAPSNKGLPPLLIVGRKGWKNEAFYELLKSGTLENEGIYFLEGATEGELAWCYKNSAYLLFPSKHEGFGLPILEAFAYGKNCLLSDIEVFREIGQGCRFASPIDYKEWARQILEIANPLTRKKEKPRKLNMKDWSWKRAARQVSRALDDSLQSHNVKN